MTRALAALLAVACGAPPTAAVEPTEAPANPDEVRLAANATMADVIAELRRSLAARGHDEGDCFLAWDVEADDPITVHVGERSRSAAVTCGGLDARALEGRCVFLRLFWVAGEDLATEAITFYFAPPGRAYAARPLGGAGVSSPAADVLFDAEPEDVRIVLGVPLRERSEQSGRGPAPGAAITPERDNPLEDPEIAEALRQLVARVQRCNEDAHGSLVLEWNIDGEGDVQDVQPLTATVPESVVQCAVNVLSEASFPANAGGEPVDYCVPVLLDPALRPE